MFLKKKHMIENEKKNHLSFTPDRHCTKFVLQVEVKKLRLSESCPISLGSEFRIKI